MSGEIEFKEVKETTDEYYSCQVIDIAD